MSSLVHASNTNKIEPTGYNRCYEYTSKFKDTIVDLLNQKLFATKTEKISIKSIKKSREIVNYKKFCPHEFIARFRCVIALQ